MPRNRAVVRFENMLEGLQGSVWARGERFVVSRL